MLIPLTIKPAKEIMRALKSVKKMALAALLATAAGAGNAATIVDFSDGAVQFGLSYRDVGQSLYDLQRSELQQFVF